jgi:hypothetical protein
MATSARLAVADIPREWRDRRPVRITHWVNVLTFVALTVSGIGILLAHPRFYWGEVGYFDTGELPLSFFKSLPSRAQITQQSCEEGWFAIGEWKGVQLSRVLQEVGILPQARYVVFQAVDGWWDSVDMADALHPQTLLSYGMNGGDLPVPHGAPLRLRVERQLGYKSLKFLSRMTVTDRLDNIKDGTGSGSFADGFAWYAGI